VVDYAKLADIAKQMQDAEKISVDKQQERKVDPRIFFESVRAHLIEEMNKANVELSKRKTVGFSQSHMPGFDGEIFLTFGTDLLCRVTLVVLGGRCEIKAVISGPPNGYELSRREYPLNQQEADAQTPDAGETVVSGISPYQIAVDIISSVLVGKFS
jgi:hypothetical protein